LPIEGAQNEFADILMMGGGLNHRKQQVPTYILLINYFCASFIVNFETYQRLSWKK
jgi:hypothetical protein